MTETPKQKDINEEQIPSKKNLSKLINYFSEYNIRKSRKEDSVHMAEKLENAINAISLIIESYNMPDFMESIKQTNDAKAKCIVNAFGYFSSEFKYILKNEYHTHHSLEIYPIVSNLITQVKHYRVREYGFCIMMDYIDMNYNKSKNINVK